MNLQCIRKKKGMSQEDIAKSIGLSRQAISNIENGNRSPSVETAKKIAEVLDFEWTEFFPDENKVG